MHDSNAASDRIDSFEALRARAVQLGPKPVAVAAAEDGVALAAVGKAASLGIARPILVGEPRRIREEIDALGEESALRRAPIVPAADPEEAAAGAVRLAREGGANVLLKGRLRTDQLLRAVLDREGGLRTGRVLSDVLVYEDTLTGRRLVGVTDGGINVLPDLDQKKQIIENGVRVFHALGFARPRVAILSATEAVSEKLPSTVDAKALAEMGARGAFGSCELFGPLALDNALLPSAAETKGIVSPVAGRADLMVVPNIETGNVLGKGVKYLGRSACGHVIAGSKVPILIPSRVESAEDKLNAIALGVVVDG